MIDISLLPLANQELSIAIEGARYVITIKEANGVMAATIIRDGVMLVQNTRIVTDGLILQYRDQWFGSGNFMLGTQDEEIPYFDKFGSTQFLVYVTAAEMSAAGLV